MKKKTFRSAGMIAAAAIVVAGAFCGQVWAVNDVNAIWSFEGVTITTPGNTGSTPPGQPFAVDEGFVGSATGFHSNTSSAWTAITGNGSSKSLNVNTWTGGDYFQFQTDNSSLNSNFGLQFDQVSSSTGPRDFKVQYSTNGTSFTDLPGATYSVQPNTGGNGSYPAWSQAGAVGPTGLDTYTFDLRSITALNTAPNIYVRLTAAASPVAAALGSGFAATGTNRVDNVGIFYNFDPTQPAISSTFFPDYKIKQPFAAPVLPIAGDVVIGLNSARTSTTLELVRGTVTPGGATRPAPLSPWTTQNYTKLVKFDNLGGTAHNVHGNLLGVDPGTSAANGGNIYSYATQGTQPLPAPQLLATTNTASGTPTRLGGLSVSPGNTKIAMVGMDTGTVLVYDYTAGNGLGTGAALGNLRQTAAVLDNYVTGTAVFGGTLGSQEGTAWLNDNTALAFSASGNLYEVAVAAGSATASLKKTVATSPILQSSTALAYNPAVSPYIYAMYSGFATPTTKNTLFVFDPAGGAYTDLTGGGLDFSTSTPNTVRDIALDANGNLVLVTNASSATPTGQSARLEYITAANLTSLSANSAVEWFYDDIFQFQPGYASLDIGFAPPAGITGDYNSDGKVNAQDYVIWRKTNINGAQGYTDWRANYGTGGPGAGSGLGGASVPEPTSALLLVIGLAAFCPRRRSA